METVVEIAAGTYQTIVVYEPPDTGEELAPVEIFDKIADDAAKRSAEGFHIVSMTVMPLRHAGVLLGNDGSGYQTRTAVVVVYSGQ